MIEIHQCNRCLYTSNHPLGLTIDDDGICSGCRVHEEKDALDWSERWLGLEDLVRSYRSKSSSIYDCIVPVTGAQDSYYILHIVKERLGLNPLLVSYNKYWNTPVGIKNLANLRIRFNCDILIQNVNPKAVKGIVKNTLRSIGSIYWHCIAGQTVFPVQTAVRYKIPLIIWGAHQGMEQVGMFSHEHEPEMTRRYRKDHDLMGLEADDLLSNFDTLTESDIWQYRYPEDDEINAIGVRGIYLNNYVRWDPKLQHEAMIERYGYLTSRFSRTFDCYDYVDCYNYMGVHDLLKFYKTGFSKVTDHACREIRHGRLSKERALILVDWFQNQSVNYFDMLCEWLGVEQRSLQFVLDLHRSEGIWFKNELGEWCRNNDGRKDAHITNVTSLGFNSNASLSLDKNDGYIVIGKGWS